MCVSGLEAWVLNLGRQCWPDGGLSVSASERKTADSLATRFTRTLAAPGNGSNSTLDSPTHRYSKLMRDNLWWSFTQRYVYLESLLLSLSFETSFSSFAQGNWLFLKRYFSALKPMRDMWTAWIISVRKLGDFFVYERTILKLIIADHSPPSRAEKQQQDLGWGISVPCVSRGKEAFCASYVTSLWHWVYSSSKMLVVLLWVKVKENLSHCCTVTSSSQSSERWQVRAQWSPQPGALYRAFSINLLIRSASWLTKTSHTIELYFCCLLKVIKLAVKAL